MPRLSSHHLIPVKLVIRCLKFHAELPLPIFAVETDVNDSVEIGRYFNITFDQCGYALWSEFANKEAKLDYDILPSTVV